MDAKQLFRSVSEKMRNDFQLAAHFNHKGTRGTVRENTLRDFLAKGRLPRKYGLGAGEVVGHVRDVSRQCDIIVYDSMYGLSLHYDEHSQIYPIDSVYGIIEVKSGLSKAELIDSLEKIKALKEMSLGGAIAEPLANGYTVVRPRPKPFGVVFAYSLSDNSLDSLCENLQEWESKNPPTSWPNYICILGVGCIYHQSGFESCIDSETITVRAFPLSLKYESDSLFKFYCALHDMCSRMKLGPVELERYFDPGVRIGRFSVFGRAAEVQLTLDGKPPVPARLKESTLEKIVAWCAKTEKIKYSDILKKRVGVLPIGLTEGSAGMNTLVYLYNPDNFPGLDDLRANPPTDGNGPADHFSTLLNVLELVIDGTPYVLAAASLPPSEWDTLE
ncbi:DUF6602 domain-containing protein [Paraburkholderia caribensis]|uniref:DUF6602 domain-containing protein n=1 Tax=Paraburkholderia caribensis TaxID=75105 RepID=UPI000A98D2DD|nr:DUF6602 domain-containing protein [Paraburkholderia caribensis]AUT51929.1 hypothetical protein C2L66_08725 [Paraburkholderia caribensis]